MANYPKIKSASTVIAFDNPVSVLPDLTISGPVTFSKSTSGQQPTWSTKVTIIADGVNAPNFDAFDSIGTGTYDNTNGVKNICIFTYWGDSLYTVCITPVTISSGSGDTTAPTLTSGNATDSTHVTLVFSENVVPTVTGWSLYDSTTLTTYSFGSVSGSGNTWTFVLASGTLTAGNTLSVSYNATTGNTLDTAGNELVTISNQSITNGVGGGTTLNAPTGLTLGTATSTTQPLTWADTNSSPNESGVKVYKNTVNNFGTATLVTTTAADATSYTLTGLTASTTYYYWVVAAGNGTTTLDSSPSSVASGSTASGGYDTDAVTVHTAIEATGVTLTTGQKDAINARIVAIKAQGKWTDLVAYYGYVGGTAAAHAINWKSPGTYDITWAGTQTHSANGVLFDGSTGYGDTGVNDNTVLNLDAVTIGAYSRTNTNNGFALGANLSSGNGLYLADRSSMIVRLHDTSDASAAMTPTRTLMATRQVAAPKYALYRDGSQLTVGSSAGVAKVTHSLYVGAIWSDAGPGAAGFSDKSYGSHFIFNVGFTASEAATFAADETTFQTALSRNV